METLQKMRIHPLAAGAAVAVIIASAVGVAAMTGHLPGSNAAPAASQQLAVAPPAPSTPPPAYAPAPAAPAAAMPPEPAPRYDSAPPPPAVVAQPAPAAPACRNCGVVESVNAYQQKPKNSPVGMIGGGVVGALVGSQIGHGTTNTLATVGGAAGGAYLGNKVGQKVETKTRYRVVIRMDDGRTKTVTYASPPQFAAGSHVRLENGRMLPA